MKHLGLVPLLCSLFTTLTPSPAHAISWWKLEQLSGPRFLGPTIDLRSICWTDKFAKTDQSAKADQPADRERSFVEGQVIRGGIFSFCKLQDTERRRGSIDLNFGFLTSEPDKQFADGKRIYLITAGPSVAFHVAGPFELGAGVYFDAFFSGGLQTFSKIMLEPIRLDIRPLHFSVRNDAKWWQEVVVVRTGLLAFPTGFAASDLGAVDRIPGEVKQYWAILIDTDPWIRHKKGRWCANSCR
jgi:hypothetical protein